MKCNAIAIVGLGLIGGSLLKALQGFDSAVFYGIDTNEETLAEAGSLGLIHPERDTEKILRTADVVIICLSPELTPDFINRHQFKKEALVTDVCGIKQEVYRRISKPEVRFIGGHPMAGKEASGFSASEKTLFQNASYLLTPDMDSLPEHVELLKRMAQYIGCRETVITTPEQHDRMIAYTSQLMHVVAVALCDSKRLDKAKSFSAGSLRDCTRVAKLDSRLWTQLFMQNKAELACCIDEFEKSLQALKGYLTAEDEEGLESFLKQASERKMKFLA